MYNNNVIIINCQFTNYYCYYYYYYYYYCHVLEFSEKPTITQPTAANVSYNKGSPVNIRCEASGEPDPDVQWIHNGQVKSSGSTTAYLTFSAINKEDAGIYTCRANNSAGSTEKQLNLVVTCKYYSTCSPYNSDLRHRKLHAYLEN